MVYEESKSCRCAVCNKYIGGPGRVGGVVFTDGKGLAYCPEHAPEAASARVASDD